ncbi:hypothetical protein [Agreia sp. COWG]|uniref:hypothetical protein n=1 Tax=Agreia sp. COWG TaxID=2773266 RepID=UPI0019251F8A|nr:hypothetical protein [Agreia sp. COWG]CAD5999425.1 protein of unknown function [Agreia sp. COWG]
MSRSNPAPGPTEYPEGIPARPATRGDRWRVWRVSPGVWAAEPTALGVYALWPETPGLPLLSKFRKKQYTAKTWAAALNFADMKQRHR